MADLVDSVYLICSMTEDDERELADDLFGRARDVYEETLDDLIASVNRTGSGRLTDSGELSALKDHARQSAASIRATFNRDLLRALEHSVDEWVSNHDSTEGMNRAWLAKQVREWEAARSEWKSAQIAITEDTATIDRARAEFFARNPMQGKARVLPDDAVCAICQGYVARGWVSLAQSDAFTLPVHPNCPHWVEVEVTGEAPPDDELWRGE